MVRLQIRRMLAFVLTVLAAGVLPLQASAQSTDGFHSFQVFPVVVDSASFVQRFNFQNRNANDLTLSPRYYPGTGTSQPSMLECPNFVVPANSEKVFTSLRAMCPSLVAGSQFGMLYIVQYNSPYSRTYSAFSRVSNIAGAGFSVEGFPVSTFSSATTVVNGIRRLAAGAGTPAYQTNCFVGNLPVLVTSPVNTAVDYVIRSNAGVQIGAGTVNLAPGSLVRLLDVFAAGGAAAGDENDATITFSKWGASDPALMAFCTVQDNTSFGADFRIAKAAQSQPLQELGPSTVSGPQDIFMPRDFMIGNDGYRDFIIPAGGFSNVHVISYHAPDHGQCELINGNTNQPATADYGLEIRAMTAGGTTVLGGNDSLVVPDLTKGNSLYFGDKDAHPGNSRMFLQVESNGQNVFASRPYKLRCRSGSGMSIPYILKYQTAVLDF